MRTILTLLAFLIFGSATGSAQTYRVGISGIYGSPAFGSFFKDGFESRVGFRLHGAYNSTERLNIGGSVENIRFVPYIDNPISISEAKYYALTFKMGYNILSDSENRLEPFIETGYYMMIYNPGALFGQSMGINLGGEYFLKIEKTYGLSLGFRWTSVFDKFGKVRNPNDVNHMQILFIQGGFVFFIK